MLKPRIFLGIITQNQVENIKQLCEVAPYFDGIFAVDHFSTDGTFEVLEKNKGAGDIIQMPFLRRHDYSMNGFLFNPKFRDGDWCLLRDSCERVNPNFASKIHDIVASLERLSIRSVYQYSKMLMFKKNSNHMFIGSPHWGLHGCEPQAVEIEKQPGFETPESYCYSIRHLQRGRDHFIHHYLKYYFEYSGFSNNLLLGRENKQDEFLKHEQVRKKFITHCLDQLKFKDTDVEELIAFWKNNPLDYNMKFYLNFEPILNDAYCYFVLNHDVEAVRSRRGSGAIFTI